MASKAARPKKVDLNINDMDLYQTSAIKKQLDSEIEILEQSVIDLHNARSKFTVCSETVESFENVPNGNQIMVPLTTSLYVPGRTINNDQFLLDVGTGYYIEQDRKNAKNYFERKVKFLNTQIDKIVKSIQEKVAIRHCCIQRQQQLVMAQAQATANNPQEKQTQSVSKS